MPVRNAESTLRRSIESVLGQTYGDFDLICVLNGSTDHSDEILNEYRRSDHRVSVLHSSPGIVPALNRGLHAAATELIARQDADDLWYSEKLEAQVDYMSRNPEIDILGVQIRCVDTDFMPFTRQESNRPITDSEIKRALLSEWNCMAHPGVIFRRRIMDRLGGYDDTFSFAEDYSLWLRAIQWYKFANLDRVLVDYTAKYNPKYNHAVPKFLCSVYRSAYGVTS
jgi:glycosyltransferase involved in cell wall biosynthesis